MMEWGRWLGGSVLRLDVAERLDAPPALDFVVTAWWALVLLAVRLACEQVFIPLLGSALRTDMCSMCSKKKAAHVFDDLFIGCCASLLEALAIYNTFFVNGGCTPTNTDPCLVGWPENHQLNILQRLYFILMFHYYLYEMISTALGVGTVLKTDMVVHHIATMMLISISYSINLVRYGTMWQALFDLSNPLLHFAKLAHVAQLPVLKDVMLPIFALVFFVCRIAMAPYSILRPALTQAWGILGPTYASIFIGLMLFVCTLQLIWFYKIVQIAMKGDKKAGQGGKKDE